MIDLLRALAALIMVTGLLAACVWIARHFLRIRQQTMLANNTTAPVILGGTWLDTKRKLVSIRWGNKEYLICVGPSGERRIASRPATPANNDHTT